MNPKVDDLRARLKADPKSRLFYQLAEELRRSGQAAEAEQVLRSGVEVHPTYLAAWVSLGRVLREKKDDRGAVQALSRALQLDPGNVVAARLLGDAYLGLGDKLEAIKKFKLVQALLPGDEELEATIERLDRELNPPVQSPAAAAPDVQPSVAVHEPPPAEDSVRPTVEVAAPAWEGAPVAPEAGAEPAETSLVSDAGGVKESPFDKTLPPFADAADSFGRASAGGMQGEAGVVSPLPEENPFGDLDGAQGLEPAPAPGASPLFEAEAAAPEPEPERTPEAEPSTGSEPVRESGVESPDEGVSDTLTMADLFARQGLVSEASRIYAKILARDPGNEAIRVKLEALQAVESGPAGGSKVVRLERWLARVSRREANRV